MSLVNGSRGEPAPARVFWQSAPRPLSDSVKGFCHIAGAVARSILGSLLPVQGYGGVIGEDSTG